MEYLSLIVSFIVGGGLSTLVNFKLAKHSQEITNKSQEVDFADKAMKFMEDQNDKLMARIVALEIEVKNFGAFKCEKVSCPTRIPPL